MCNEPRLKMQSDTSRNSIKIPMKKTKVSPNKNLAQQDLSDHDLSNQNLSYFNLTGTKLNGSNLRFTKLNAAKMQDAQLYGANLTEAKLCGAQLSDAKLTGADLTGANLTEADLTGADLRQVNLRNANLSGTNLSGANVQSAQFTGSTGLTEDTIRDLKKRGAIFNGTPLRVSDLRVSDIQWMQLIANLAAVLTVSSGILSVYNTLNNENSSVPTLAPTVESVTQETPSPKSTTK